MKYELPKLTYDYNALEPYIDAQTMEIHYTKHHQTYITNLNAVLEKYPNLQDNDLAEMMKNIDKLGMNDADKMAFRNSGGGHLNHTFFWSIMGPKKEINEELSGRISQIFGSMDSFKEQFTNAATTRFGSGWAWLVETDESKLRIYSTPNQDSPLLTGDTPLIGLDVWEHAYYLKYQNRRPEYITNWWSVLKLI
jgi:Fe-Mn family superoxide dismutase